MNKPGDYPLHVLAERSFIASDNSAAFGEQTPNHRIDFYAIVWFSETRGQHLIDFEPFPVKKNLVYLIGRNQVHSIPAERLPMARIIVFSAALFERIEESHLRQLFLPFQNAGISIPSAMLEPMIRLFDLILLETKGAAEDALLLKYLGAFLTQLYRFSERQHASSAGLDQRIVRLFQLLQAHYKEEKSAQFYADRIGLTPKRINELLRAQVGSTISQLIYQLLVIEAKRELFRQELSIKEIAYELGFSEQSYFARFFKKHTGQTPEAFRKASQKATGAVG